MNNYSEMWAEFCFLLSENINRALPEKDFENQVVRALEVLGWREFRHEIERQPNLQFGSVGTLRPDLIIYGHDRKALIVIEVKRPSEDIARDNIIGQLRSYMRQMKSDFGFLIGVDLRVYYDGLSNPHPDPVLLERIEFERHSSEGIKFLEFFNKQSFLNQDYKEYLESKIKKINKKREVKSIIDKLLSPETKKIVINHLRNEFPDIGDETFSEAIEQINVNISRIADAEIIPSIRPKHSRRENPSTLSGHDQPAQSEPAYIKSYRRMLQNPDSLPSKIKKYIIERGGVSYSDLKRFVLRNSGVKMIHLAV